MKRHARTRKPAQVNISNDMGVTRIHPEVQFRSTIDRNNNSIHLRHLLRAYLLLHLKVTEGISPMVIKKLVVVSICGVHVGDLQCHHWVPLLTILVITLITSTTLMLSTISITITINNIMVIPVSTTQCIINTIHLINTITMATSPICLTGAIMDTTLVQMDKPVAKRTKITHKNVCFLLWRLIRTVCLTGSVMFGQRWLRFLQRLKRMCRRDTRRERRN
mmetsp:Transcript_24036/g.66619  ORF Transcript_24036/g.66619 Transcript_24036/m.66619 type:complete len:220 (-) Transcript_24036:757-1416(-)